VLEYLREIIGHHRGFKGDGLRQRAQVDLIYYVAAAVTEEQRGRRLGSNMRNVTARSENPLRGLLVLYNRPGGSILKGQIRRQTGDLAATA
jgi:hypothetical protein